jgi:hypothetical protein
MNDQPTTNSRSARLAREIAECRGRALEVVAKAREVLSQPCPDAFAGGQYSQSHSHAKPWVRPVSMKDMQAHLKTLRAQIAQCKRLERESKRSVKRDIFKRLTAHYKILADELERAIAQAGKDQEENDQA